MTLFCSHNWEKIHDEITKTRFEILKEHEWTPQEVNPLLLYRKKIIILKCSKCGKLDKTIVDL